MDWAGARLKDLIKANNLSIVKLAEMAGVSRQTVNDWIRGQVPRGNHLIFICRTFNINPDFLFSNDYNGSISVPVHRTRKTAKVTPAVQSDALNLAREYELFFRNEPDSGVLPVIRGDAGSPEAAKKIAEAIRGLADIGKDLPPDYEHTFALMEKLGIKIVFRNFPKKIKTYAFYTKIHGHRVVFINKTTNIIDLIFPLLHEAVHAVRDELRVNNGFDEEEEAFCDMVANHVQFPDEYVKMVYNFIKDLRPAVQINKLKYFGRRYNHALFGIVYRIQSINPDFKLKVRGADTNLKKEFPTIGDILFKKKEPRDYVNTVLSLSPLFINTIINQLEGLTDRKLGELLGIENIMDARAVRDELVRLTAS